MPTTRPTGPPAEAELVPPGLRAAGGYAWRLIALAAAGWLVLQALAAVRLVVLALFGALLLTALLRPLLGVLSRVLPHGLAVAASVLAGLVILLGAFAFIGASVANKSAGLAANFDDGIAGITTWLHEGPLHLSSTQLSAATKQVGTALAGGNGTLAHRALGGAAVAADVLAAVALVVFCTVCLLHSGPKMWVWFLEQLPESARARFSIAGSAAWDTFGSYTRGTVLIASTNALLVCVVLLVLRVPLAVPLALVVLFASFLPLIGAPLALMLATVVALAGRGPVVALLVAVLIVVIGQLESHVLQPLVMSRAVRLAPLVVALSVVSGALLAGIAGAVVAVPVVAVAWSVRSALRAAAAQPPVPEPDIRDMVTARVDRGAGDVRVQA